MVCNSALTPQRRRSRAKSGDSLSASADEAASVGIEAHQEFRFPKHKKHMVAEYLGNADRYNIVQEEISSFHLSDLLVVMCCVLTNPCRKNYRSGL